MGKVYVVGLGPGADLQMTGAAAVVLERVRLLLGIPFM